MAESNFTLDLFYREWQQYQDHIKQAIAPLTDEQLALCAAPGLRSIRELVYHIIDARVDWFTGFMAEDAVAVQSLSHPDEPDYPRSATELAQDLDISWKLMADCLARWGATDMQHTFPIEWRGDPYNLSRSWVVWHILEHDLHHGGEVSLTLGIHGLQAPDI
jgi:uncharacterized damage-inducible protein DinB